LASGNKHHEDHTGALEITQMNDLDGKININMSEKKDTVERGNDEDFERAIDSE